MTLSTLINLQNTKLWRLSIGKLDGLKLRHTYVVLCAVEDFYKFSSCDKRNERREKIKRNCMKKPCHFIAFLSRHSVFILTDFCKSSTEFMVCDKYCLNRTKTFETQLYPAGSGLVRTVVTRNKPNRTEPLATNKLADCHHRH